MLFPEEGLLLFSPLKASNLLNRFASIVLKCGKYPSLVFPVPVVLFYELFPFAVTLIVIPISRFIKLNMFETVVVFWD